MLILVLAAVIGFSQGTKDKPITENRQQQEAAQAAQPIPPPITVTVTSPPQSEEEKRAEAEQRKRDVDAQETMARFTVALFVLGVFQFFAAAAAVIAAIRAANAANATVSAMCAADQHFRVVERAYVSMSHEPPGIDFSPSVTTTGSDPIPSRDVSFVVLVRNSGNTPARITAHNAHVVISDEPLPTTPAYQSESELRVEAFLVTSGEFKISGHVPVADTEWTEIWEGRTSLYVIGYVDYLDQFGQRHRSGYARVYQPSVDRLTRRHDISLDEGRPHIRVREDWLTRNNLWFVDTPAYNYDRRRRPSEGTDWDEHS